jgi:hypothetical protein
MMGEEAPETCWATHKRQVINSWNCCILLVNLFESYDDARTYERQIFCSYFPVITGGYYLFSGTYFNKFSVSVLPSDREYLNLRGASG